MPMQSYDVYGMQQGKKPIGPNTFYPNNYYPNQPPFYPKSDSMFLSLSDAVFETKSYTSLMHSTNTTVFHDLYF